jgi:diketogulonate reductase-like aldo/keto reductase
MYKIWAQMEELVNKGLVKSIGLSNFNVQLIWDLLSYAVIPPVVNEIEYHPYLTQIELLEFMRNHSITPLGYYLFKAERITLENGHPVKQKILEDPVILQLAKKYDCSTSQLLLSWGVKNNVIPNPKYSK